jgi:hypothetical protein
MMQERMDLRHFLDLCRNLKKEGLVLQDGGKDDLRLVNRVLRGKRGEGRRASKNHIA